MRVIGLLLACLTLTACSTVEADPVFLVIGVEETTYYVNVVSGRPAELEADNWHKQHVAKEQFGTEVREGDHVICHLVEKDAVELTNCRTTEEPTVARRGPLPAIGTTGSTARQR